MSRRSSALETAVRSLAVAVAATLTPLAPPLLASSKAPPGFAFAAASLRGAGLPECSGTLLPGGWVLTAAHCPVADHVVVGRVSLDDGAQGHRVKVVQCFQHSGFTGKPKFENDIALLRLESSPAGVPSVAPAAEEEWDEEMSSKVTFAGWGGHCAFGDHLCSSSVTVVKRSKCRKIYAKSGSKITVDGTNVCSLSLVDRVHNADSGGPVLAAVEGKLRLVGVISTGMAPVPDRHIWIAKYLGWIDSVRAGQTEGIAKKCGG